MYIPRDKYVDWFIYLLTVIAFCVILRLGFIISQREPPPTPVTLEQPNVNAASHLRNLRYQENLRILLIQMNSQTPSVRSLATFYSLVKACEKVTYGLYVRAGGNPTEVAQWVANKNPIVGNLVTECLVDTLKYGQSRANQQANRQVTKETNEPKETQL